MDFLVKSLYSLLFGVAAYTLFLIFSAQANNKRKLEIGCLVALAAIAAINIFSIAPRFVPAAEIWKLVIFDFSVPTLYVMMQRRLSNVNDNLPRIMNDDILSSQLRKFRASVFLNLFIIMLYIYQLVSIWLLTKHYLIEAIGVKQ